MIHHSLGAARRLARIIGAVGGPLLAITAGGLSNPASAGGAPAPDPQPTLRGSYCEGSDQDLAPPARASGCARISGYIAAGARFERIGGRADPFAPIDQPGIAGDQASGVTIVGAPLSGEHLSLPESPSDAAR